MLLSVCIPDDTDNCLKQCELSALLVAANDLSDISWQKETVKKGKILKKLGSSA